MEKYKVLDENELQSIEGGFTISVGIALFMAGYTIGKDIANRKK